MKVVDVPEKFIPTSNLKYPPHQDLSKSIEPRAFDFFSDKDEIKSEYAYLPVQWNAFHLNNGYGKILQPLQDYLDALVNEYPNQKWFTITQYAGGTLVKVDNCRIFSTGGGFNSPLGINSTYEPIPLICDPHPGEPVNDKKYKVGFAGRLDTHPIRQVMYEKLKKFDDYKFYIDTNWKPDRFVDFREILYNSIFALAPRGYGPTSFRLYEAIEMECIPIYIGDDFWLPFEKEIDWKKLSLLIKHDEIDTIPERVNYLIDSGEYKNYLEYGKIIHEKFFTWNGCLNTIAKIVTC
tara:strand:- start:2964 stop:3842 length:879 start_codon:yes stop_codon:yes gene_type:complete